MAIVTTDATSGLWVPASSVELTSLLSGTTISNPGSLWLLQQSSGSLADSVGSQPLTQWGGGIAYAQTFAGWTRLGIRNVASSGGVLNSVGPIGASNSALITAYVYLSGLPIDGQVIINWANGVALCWHVTGGHAFLQLKNGALSTSLAIGTATYEGASHLIALQIDVTNGLIGVTTELETFSIASSNRYSSTTMGFFVNGGTADTYVPWAAGWSNTSAELSAANIAILVDRLWNGPAVTSIVVAPSTLSLLPPATSMLTATATRVDTSTYDATATAIWSTSAPTVATVVAGLVSALAAGAAMLTASVTSLGASPTSGMCAFSGIALTSLVIAPADVELSTIGASQAVTATAFYSDSSRSDVTSSAIWASSRPTAATVDSTGGVTAVARGTAQILATFTSAAGSASGSASVLVSTMTDAYTSVLVALMPPGRLWRWFAEGILYRLLAGCAIELSRLDARTVDLLDEDDPSTAIETLPDYESQIDLPSTGTYADRQARIIANLIAQQGCRPADFQSALAPLLAQAVADVAIIERSAADAAELGDARKIFRFFVYRDPTLPGAYSLDDVQALINKITPSHNVGQVIESIDLICDDSHSLCDRDLMGA